MNYSYAGTFPKRGQPPLRLWNGVEAVPGGATFPHLVGKVTQKQEEQRRGHRKAGDTHK